MMMLFIATRHTLDGFQQSEEWREAGVTRRQRLIFARRPCYAITLR